MLPGPCSQTAVFPVSSPGGGLSYRDTDLFPRGPLPHPEHMQRPRGLIPSHRGSIQWRNLEGGTANTSVLYSCPQEGDRLWGGVGSGRPDGWFLRFLQDSQQGAVVERKLVRSLPFPCDARWGTRPTQPS